MGTAGQRLRQARLRCRLTYRDVARAAEVIAGAKHNSGYLLPISRLSEIENHGAEPSIYRIYTLAALYRLSFRDVLGWFGVDLQALAADQVTFEPPRAALYTRLIVSDADGDNAEAIAPVHESRQSAKTEAVPKRTQLLKGEAEALVPVLERFYSPQYHYALVGGEDNMMDPLIPSGSLLQIDTQRRHVQARQWRNEFERPVYLVAHREGYVCSWVSSHAKTLILQPHPLSPCSPQVFLTPQQAEVFGQVVGVSKSLIPEERTPRPPSAARRLSASR